MLTGRELKAFRKNLMAWFRQYQRDLPWRRTRDPYRIWLSEIMLQQTRVAAVIPYYEKFAQRFPTVRALAEAPQQEVLQLWAGLGYYSRARNLQRAAQQIMTQHGGVVPSTEVEILALAGIGSYTAAAILSIAFGAPHAVLDGNVARVLARIFAVRGDLREPKRWQSLQKHATQLLDEKSPGNWNQAMMELGATICTPRSPKCLLCPVAAFCAARKMGIAAMLPEKRKKRETVRVTLAAAVILDRRGRTVLLPPPANSGAKPGADHVPALVSKMWHFPTVSTGNIPAVELPDLIKKFILKKYFGNSSKNLIGTAALHAVRHAVTYRSVAIFPFRILVTKLPTLSGAAILALNDLSSLPISNLTRKVAQAALTANPAHSSIRAKR